MFKLGKVALLGTFMLTMALLSYSVSAEEGIIGGDLSVGDGLMKAGLAIGAGLAAGAAAAGAGIGVGTAGAASLGAIAEKREMLTWSLVFVALAEGVALYGLAVAFILIGKL